MALAGEAGIDRARTGAPTLGELFRTFLKIGILSFGGAAGQIALMHRIVVDEKRWLDEARFLHALNYCMLLPGPEAQQLATYIGWSLHGVRGGLVSGVLFVLPGALIMTGLGALYVLGAGLTVVDGLFFGIKAAVLAIVAQALLKIAAKSLKGAPPVAIALAAFVLMTFSDAPFPLVVLGAGLIGYLAAPASASAVAADAQPGRTRRALLTAGLCLAAWWTPIALAAAVAGPDSLLVDLGLFFSKLAVLTFGGAYAVLAWLAQEAVSAGWVTPGQMIDGLGLAETTPGPTILVNQFVGFLGGAAQGGLGLAALGAAMAVWATFAPSFLWIFAGAPFVEELRGARRLAGALHAVTAAVVGVIGFVAAWFALNVLFGEVAFAGGAWLRWPVVDVAALDGAAAALAALAFVLLFGLRQPMMRVVGVTAALGAAMQGFGLVG